MSIEEGRENYRINRIELAGKIVQIGYTPDNRRYDWGVMDYSEDPRWRKEVMLLFPQELYIQEDVVGKYMMLQGKVTQDEDGDTVVHVEAMVPCTKRRTRCVYRPEWWKGPMNIPGYSEEEILETVQG